MKPELRPLLKRLPLTREERGGMILHTGSVEGTDLVATMTGIGTALATKVTEQLLDTVDVDHVIVVGIAGGVGPDAAIGDLVLPEVVILGETGSEHRPVTLGGHEPHGKIVTGDELLIAPEVVEQLERDGVVALDMETASVAVVCERRGVPWSVFRSISDSSLDDLVDDEIAGMATPEGSANAAAVLRYVFRRPWRIPRLMKLGRDMQTAANAAARAAVQACKEWAEPTTSP